MSRSLAVLAAMTLGSAVACGGGSGGSGPPSPQPSPDPTASPTPSPTPSASPTPAPTASPTPAPTSSAGELTLEISRVDAAPECDGLVPDRAPPPVSFAAPMPAGATCLGGTGDGTGHVAVGARDGDVVTWVVHRPDGSVRGQVSGPGLEELARQAEGWHGVISTPLDSPFQSSEHVRVGVDGAIATRTPLAPPEGFLVNDVRLAADPGGGSAVVAAVTAIGGNHSSRTTAFRFGAAGAPAHPQQPVLADPGPTIAFLGAGLSRSGEMIVTQRVPGTFVWSWLARDGTPLAAGEVSQLAVGANDPVHLEPLLDGSVAARFDGAWSAVIPHLGTTAAAAPAWLSARRGTALRFTRGNRGYAVLPPRGEALPDCAQVVELRAPSGLLCGRVTIRDGGGSCVGGVVEQGWDGTLIQQSPREPCSGASCTCAVSAWPRLLAGP